MAEIVGGFVVPHNPIMFHVPDAPSAEQKQVVLDAYAATAARISELKADTAIIIGCDHYILYGTECLPPYVISTGELDGPVDQLPGLKRGPIACHAELGTHICREGFESGFDWTVGRAMAVDHSVAIPHHYMIKPNAGIKTVAVMLACGVDPYLPMKRAWELGEQIAAAVKSFPGNERIVVIGSGGISHHVGDERMGEVNPDFDQRVLAAITSGDKQAMLGFTDEIILSEGGNGAMEIRTFACAMAAVGAAGGQVVAYEPITEWVTGMGFAELKAAA
ncbi:protocatechuate 3,4-dioxygenase [Rhizobium sp. Root149]|uniref:DODA-type extradiol aromatic ring-opening family dioxygenase n=1 Tax=Rhizobium sp. Root149 TaxID=1736473 RepID=UPI0007123AE9|nr:protocatechuate 3,4-dioxygenase [Rhizobium sp. Root149]KQZ57918.1 protocatechuate 3,4-dioxygenase [Rhizobium sp. Root149]